MEGTLGKAQLTTALWFPDWPSFLEASGLPPQVRSAHGLCIRWYLSWCRRGKVRVDFDSARQFVTWAQEAKAAEDWKVESWKEALRWFFRTGRQRERIAAGAGPAGVHAGEGAAEDGLHSSEQGGADPPGGTPFTTWAEWMESLVRTLRIRHMSYRTEQTYVGWAQRFVAANKLRVPREVGEAEIKAFLDELAVGGRVSASTQRQALNALVFLLREVMGRTLGDFGDYERARVRQRLPVVLTREEVRSLLSRLQGTNQLMARVMYGTGMRLMELVRLRVQDVDFGRGVVLVRRGKGDKDRVVPLPETVREEWRAHLGRVQGLHEQDRAAEVAPVWLPEALGRKYPNAGREWPWQWVWPSRELSADPRSGVMRRHHVQEGAFQAAIRKAARLAGISKPVTPHVLRTVST